MGYTTDFTGRFLLDKKLTPAHIAYLNEFANTRRMKRNPEITKNLFDPLRIIAHLPLGVEGEYYVGGNQKQNLQQATTQDQIPDIFSGSGQAHIKDIIDYNMPPSTQPGLWCSWAPSDDGMGIEWNGGEKFYHYIEWIEYIIKNFLKPWGYTVNGVVRWQGEESDDIGVIEVEDNIVASKGVKLPDVTY